MACSTSAPTTASSPWSRAGGAAACRHRLVLQWLFRRGQRTATSSIDLKPPGSPVRERRSPWRTCRRRRPEVPSTWCCSSGCLPRPKTARVHAPGAFGDKGHALVNGNRPARHGPPRARLLPRRLCERRSDEPLRRTRPGRGRGPRHRRRLQSRRAHATWSARTWWSTSPGVRRRKARHAAAAPVLPLFCLTRTSSILRGNRRQRTLRQMPMRWASSTVVGGVAERRLETTSPA